jgi:O-antigen/teichoic acid export membrane protein
MGSVKFIAMGAIVQQVLAMLVTVVVTRLLGVAGYGQMVTLVAVASTLFSVSTQWALPYALRESSVGFNESKRLGPAFTVPLLLSPALLMGLTWAAPAMPESLLAGVHQLPFLAMLCAALGYFLFQAAKAAFQIQTRFMAYSVVLCADKFTLLLAIGPLALFGVLDVQVALWVQAGSTLITGLLGLWLGVRGTWAWAGQPFAWSAYARSAAPIAVSLLISNVASLTFLIIRGGAQPAEVAWLGMSNMVLGLMLQPFNWLAPTLAPRLSMDVRAPDAPAKVRHYLEAQLDPLLWLSLMSAALAALVSLYTPVLGWIFGRAFQGAAHTIATTAFMAPAEVANMLIIQLGLCQVQRVHRPAGHGLEGRTLPAGPGCGLGCGLDVAGVEPRDLADDWRAVVGCARVLSGRPGLATWPGGCAQPGRATGVDQMVWYDHVADAGRCAGDLRCGDVACGDATMADASIARGWFAALNLCVE